MKNLYLKSLKEINDIIKERWQILSVIVTVLSVGLTYMFKLLTNSYYEGRYDCLTIPRDYIVINYEKFIIEFLCVASVCVIVFLIGYIHCYLLYLIGNGEKIIKKVLMYMVALLIIPVVISIFLVLYLLSKTTFANIWLYICNYTFDFLLCVLFFSFVYASILMAIGSTCGYYDKNDKKVADIQDIGQKNEQSEDKKIETKKIPIKVPIAALFVIILISFVGISNSMYAIGKASVNFIDQVSVIEVGEQQYVLLEPYGKEWIVKPCINNDGNLIINWSIVNRVDTIFREKCLRTVA